MRLSMNDIASQCNGYTAITFDRQTLRIHGYVVKKESVENYTPIQCTTTLCKLPDVYYEIRAIRDNDGTIVAKRKHKRAELKPFRQ